MAVVGNVGTYAQVQTLETPDFGAMVENQFDKIAQRRALEDKKKKDEAAAKAKAAKDLGSYGVYEGGSIPALDEQLRSMTEQGRTEFYQLKQSGDLAGAQKKLDDLAKINSVSKTAKEKVDKLYKDLSSSEGGIYDKDYLSKTMEEFNAYDKGNFITSYENGEIYITLLNDANEDGTRDIIAPKQTVDSWLSRVDPPLEFDEQKDLKTFVANNPVSRIESKSGNMFTTVDNVMNDKTVIDNINSHVTGMANSDSAMANWYKNTKGEYKSRGFTKQEKEEFIKDNIETYTNAYREVVSLDLQERGGGGSSKKDDVDVLPPVSLGVSSVGGMPKGTVFNKDTTKYVAIEKKGGPGIDINGNPLTGIIWDEDNSRLFYGIAVPVSGSGKADGTSMGTSQKEVKYFSSGASKAEMTNIRAKMSKKYGVQLNSDEDLINLLFKGVKPPKRDKNGVIIK